MEVKMWTPHQITHALWTRYFMRKVTASMTVLNSCAGVNTVFHENIAVELNTWYCEHWTQSIQSIVMWNQNIFSSQLHVLCLTCTCICYSCTPRICWLDLCTCHSHFSPSVLMWHPVFSQHNCYQSIKATCMGLCYRALVGLIN